MPSALEPKGQSHHRDVDFFLLHATKFCLSGVSVQVFIRDPEGLHLEDLSAVARKPPAM